MFSLLLTYLADGVTTSYESSALLIAALVAAATTLIASKSASENSSSTNKLNKQINEENNAFNAEQAEITRNWNSIGEQMARAKAAGVNPISVAMGNGSIASDSSSAQASAASPIAMQPESNAFASMMESMASSSQNYASAISEYMQTGSKKALLDKQVQQVSAQIQNLNMDTRSQMELLPYIKEQTRSEIYKVKADTKLNLQQCDNLKQQFQQSEERFNALFPSEVSTALAGAESSWLNVSAMSKQIENLDVTREMMEKQIELYSAQASESTSRTNLNYAQVDYTNQGTKLELAMTKLHESEQKGLDIANDLESAKQAYKDEIAEVYVNTLKEELQKLKNENGLTDKDLIYYEAKLFHEFTSGTASTSRVPYSVHNDDIARHLWKQTEDKIRN